jgi:hypothetical protein
VCKNSARAVPRADDTARATLRLPTRRSVCAKRNCFMCLFSNKNPNILLPFCSHITHNNNNNNNNNNSLYSQNHVKHLHGPQEQARVAESSP